MSWTAAPAEQSSVESEKTETALKSVAFEIPQRGAGNTFISFKGDCQAAKQNFMHFA